MPHFEPRSFQRHHHPYSSYMSQTMTLHELDMHLVLLLYPDRTRVLGVSTSLGQHQFPWHGMSAASSGAYLVQCTRNVGSETHHTALNEALIRACTRVVSTASRAVKTLIDGGKYTFPSVLYCLAAAVSLTRLPGAGKAALTSSALRTWIRMFPMVSRYGPGCSRKMEWGRAAP